MHAGSINNDTAAARVYATLKQGRGKWISGWELTERSRTTAVSTRISEVRTQLQENEEIETGTRDGGYYYRLTVKPHPALVQVEQLALGV